MMSPPNKYWALLLALSLFWACGEGEQKTDSEQSAQTEPITADPVQDPPLLLDSNPDISETPILADPVLHKVERFREFSHPGQKDHFLLTVTGDSIQDAWAHFKIFDHEGEEIYTVDFQTWLLVDYGILAAQEQDSSMTESRYIYTRLDSFFTEKKFMQPAIAPDEKFFPEMSDRMIWEELKGLPEAVGFFYQLGVEDGRYLSWSPRQKAVVMYLNCC